MKIKYFLILTTIILGSFSHVLWAAVGHNHAAQTETQVRGNQGRMVTVAEDKAAMLGVTTIPAQFKAITKTIRTTGFITYNETKVFLVNAKYEGWIEKLSANFTGKYVKKGDLLAEVYSPELVALEQELLNLYRWQKNQARVSSANQTTVSKMMASDTSALISAAQKKLQFFDLTKKQIDALTKANYVRKTVSLYSPVTGYIVSKDVFQGARFMPGEKIMQIADLGTVWLMADVYQNMLGHLKLGQAAKIKLSYFYPGKSFNAKIEFIQPLLNEETKTAKIRFSLPNADHKLKIGMFTEVSLSFSLGKRLVVPASAVIDSGLSKLVYVEHGKGQFEPRIVVAGISSNGLVEIISGLKPGEKVAASGNFLIDSEARLQGIVQ